MLTEDFFDLLLDLGDDWEVKGVTTSLETQEIEIYVEYLGEAKPYDYAPARRWRHLDTLQFKSFINARLPRFKSAQGQVETLCPPWADKHERHTLRFECAVIALLLATQNQTQTAKLIDCKFDVVNRIMHRASERGMRRRQAAAEGSAEVFEHLSIDEKSFQKGHHYATVLSHPQSGRVLEVVEGRTKSACKTLLQDSLSGEQQAQVKSLSMDMWPAFIASAQEQLPQTEIVHDKFHLIQYLNQAIDQVRRREVKSHPELKKSRYVLLKNQANLTVQQKLKFEQIQQANFEVSRAWQARENFKDVFADRTHDAGLGEGLEESEAIYQQWHQVVVDSGIKEVIKVAQMFSEHLRGVLNAMTTNLSNAMAERLNGKIQLLKSMARGYRKFENFRSAILFFHGKLDLFPREFK